MSFLNQKLDFIRLYLSRIYLKLEDNWEKGFLLLVLHLVLKVINDLGVFIKLYLKIYQISS